MSGAIPPIPQYAFMAWCLVNFYLYLLKTGSSISLQLSESTGVFVCILLVIYPNANYSQCLSQWISSKCGTSDLNSEGLKTNIGGGDVDTLKIFSFQNLNHARKERIGDIDT
jgi:hypothetical protein